MKSQHVHVFHVVLLFLSFHSLIVSSADCNVTSCGECVSSPGCGWCGATQMCSAGNTTGPQVGMCLGSWQNTCTECTQQLTCRGCSDSLGCVWCNTNPTDPQNATFMCHSLHYANSTTCPIRYPSCPCNDYTTCHECASVAGCSFCNTGVCEDSTANCASVSCDCVNYPTCTTCNDNPACGWCSGLSYCTSLPANCSAYDNCDAHCFNELSCLDCTAERGCAWCPTSDTCHSIDSTICGKELATQCSKHCDKVTDCNLCIDMGLPCEWCAATRSCVDIGVVSNCSTTDSCASEVCPELETCEVCLQTPGCGWCDNGKRCTDIFEPKCSLARNCSGYFARGFSLGSFFGGMATMLAAYLLIGICAYFYKKKSPPQHRYQEMH